MKSAFHHTLKVSRPGSFLCDTELAKGSLMFSLLVRHHIESVFFCGVFQLLNLLHSGETLHLKTATYASRKKKALMRFTEK